MTGSLEGITLEAGLAPGLFRGRKRCLFFCQIVSYKWCRGCPREMLLARGKETCEACLRSCAGWIENSYVPLYLTRTNGQTCIRRVLTLSGVVLLYHGVSDAEIGVVSPNNGSSACLMLPIAPSMRALCCTFSAPNHRISPGFEVGVLFCPC